MLGETALVEEQHCSLLVAQATELALAAVQVAVSVELVLPERFMVHYHHCAMRR
jgi:hypothetical protein